MPLPLGSDVFIGLVIFFFFFRQRPVEAQAAGAGCSAPGLRHAGCLTWPPGASSGFFSSELMATFNSSILLLPLARLFGMCQGTASIPGSWGRRVFSASVLVRVASFKYRVSSPCRPTSSCPEVCNTSARRKGKTAPITLEIRNDA